jgi:hypothetical protein
MSTELNIAISETNAGETASAFETPAHSMGHVKESTSADRTLAQVSDALWFVHGQTISALLDQCHIIVADRIQIPPAAPAPATEVE